MISFSHYPCLHVWFAEKKNSKRFEYECSSNLPQNKKYKKRNFRPMHQKDVAIVVDCEAQAQFFALHMHLFSEAFIWL